MKRLSLTDYGKLTFAKADEETFVCLKACKEAIRRGGLYPTAVNGANEQAVALFLEKKISFTEIGELVMEALETALPAGEVTEEAIFAADRQAREEVFRKTGQATG